MLPGAPVHPPGFHPKGEDVQLRGKKMCRVLFSYSPAHDDELQLQVQVQLKKSDGVSAVGAGDRSFDVYFSYKILLMTSCISRYSLKKG